MSSRRRQVRVELVVDASDADQFDSVADTAEGASGRMQTSWRGVGTAVAAAFAVDKVRDFAVAMFDTARESEAVGRRLDTVFGENADVVRQWADENREAFGTSSDELAGYVAGIGDLLVPMGFARDTAAELAPLIVQTGAALAEAAGKDKVQGIEAVAAALTGEREQLKQLGIVIGEADLQAEGLDGTFGDLTGATDKQRDALNTLTLIMDQGADSLALWETRAGTLTAASDSLRSSWAELRQTLAERLAPAMADHISLLNAAIGVTEGEENAARGLVDAFNDVITRAFDSAVNLDLATQSGDNLAESTRNLTDKTSAHKSTIQEQHAELQAGMAAWDGTMAALRNATDGYSELRPPTDAALAGLEAFQQEVDEADYTPVQIELENTANAFRGAVDEIDLSLSDFETNLEESLVQQTDFYRNVNLLAAAGFDDLAQTFLDEGVRSAGVLEQVVGDWEAAARLEGMIQQGKLDVAMWAAGISAGVNENRNVVVEAFRILGNDAAAAVEQAFLGLNLASLVATAINAAVAAAGGSTGGGSTGGGTGGSTGGSDSTRNGGGGFVVF